MSAISSISLSVGLPRPCPDRASIRSSNGCFEDPRRVLQGGGAM